MSLQQLEPGDPIKHKEDWSKRGKLVEIIGEKERLGAVIWEGSHEQSYIPMKDLVHFSYTWPDEIDPTLGMR